MDRRRYSICGRVQGVGFRYWTVGQAKRLGLLGWVRNCADGSVVVVVRGPSEALDQLAEALAHGPPAAWVERVETLPLEPQDEAALVATSRFRQIS